MAQTITPTTQPAGPAVERPVTRRSWTWRLILLGVLLLVVAVLAFVGVITIYQLDYEGRIYPGVRVGNISLDGLTLNQAVDVIDRAYTPYPAQPVALRYAGQSWTFSPTELGVTVDSNSTANEAYAVGRSAYQPADSGIRNEIEAQWYGALGDLLEQWRVRQNGREIRPRPQFGDGQMGYALLRIARDVDLAPKEASLAINGLDVIALPSSNGRQVNVEATRNLLLQAARAGRGGSVNLVVEDRKPALVSVEEPAAQARLLLSQPLTITMTTVDGPQSLVIDRPQFREWLNIGVVPDGNKIALNVRFQRDPAAAYLKQLATQLARPAQDAKLDFDPVTRQVKVVTPSQTGQTLDAAAALAAVEKAVMANERTVEVPVTIVKPKTDSSDLAALGIKEIVTQGTTTFKGSSKERTKNIVVAAGKFMNVVVPPGEEFSFNKHVGSISAADGFVDALVIVGDRTETGIGGGVCQVSTTVFRAAFYGGFPIVERYPHSYVVSWYGEPGLDASIFTPTADFRFRNDTSHHLLIRPEVDEKKGTITFTMWGTKPSRTVEKEGPVISNVRPPLPAVYQEDKTLAQGQIKQVDWPNSGQDATIIRRIRNADGTVKEEKFVSKYQSWKAVYLYGPGTKLPAGANTSAP